jgi:addiction module HigA family antidote
MEQLKNVHPGEILQKDFLEPLNITAYLLAKRIMVDQTRISLLITGNSRMSADTALRLAVFFEMSAEFWLNAQARYDLVEERNKKTVYAEIEPFEAV